MKRKNTHQKFNNSVTRGAAWISCMMAEKRDGLPLTLTKKMREDINATLRWVTENLNGWAE